MAKRSEFTRKKPIINRFLTLLVALNCLIGLDLPSARAQQHSFLLTEDEAVQMGLNRPEAKQVVEAARAKAESEVIEARTWPNPTFDYSRETSDEGGGDTTEDLFSLSQQVDFSGRRGLEIKAARQRLDATIQESSEWRLERASAIRRQFFETLYLQRLLEAHSGWLTRMDAIENVMRKRESAGDISGYDLRRLLRERAFVQAERQRIRAEYGRSIEELRGLIGGERTRGDLAGTLLPERLPALETLVERLKQRPGFTAMKLRQEALDTEERIGKRWWVPEITFGLGTKTVDSPSGDGSGLLLGASIPIPVFDRDTAKRQRALAERQLLNSEYRLALGRNEGRVRGLWRQATELAEEAQRLDMQTDTASGPLIDIAEAAYQSGEIGVLEILDAYRSAFDGEARVLSLMREARIAIIELDSITGVDIP